MCLIKLSFQAKLLEHSLQMCLVLCCECICVWRFILNFSVNCFPHVGQAYKRLVGELLVLLLECPLLLIRLVPLDEDVFVPLNRLALLLLLLLVLLLLC